jgi:hypothetical protein
MLRTKHIPIEGDAVDAAKLGKDAVEVEIAEDGREAAKVAKDGEDAERAVQDGANADRAAQGGKDIAADGNRTQGPYSDLEDSPTVGPGKKYTPAQKAKIYEANREANSGVLRSDGDGTELVLPNKSQKGVTPPNNEAQVDHYKPRGPSDPDATPGSNSYENARVLARGQNRKKSNT